MIMPMIAAVIIGTFSVLAFRSSLQLSLFYTRHLQVHRGDRRGTAEGQRDRA